MTKTATSNQPAEEVKVTEAISPAPGKVELTPREIAIARGEDPDKEPAAPATPVPVAETPPDPPAETTEKEDWATNEHLALANSYGLDVKNFKTAAEFLAAGQDIDRKLAAGDAPPPTPKPAGQPPAEPAPEGAIPSLDPQDYINDEFDEKTVAVVRHAKALSDDHAKLKTEMEQLRAQVAESDRTRAMAAFHDAADMINPDRFGRSLDDDGIPVPITDEQNSSREKLHTAASTIVAGIVSQARSAGKEPVIPPLPVLLRRAENLAFAADIRRQEQERLQDALVSQSSRRRPAGSRRAAVAPTKEVKSEVDPIAAIVNHPDVVKNWDRLQQQNGSA